MWGHRSSLGTGRRRSGRHVYHLVARRCGNPLRQVRIVTPGIDRDRVAEPNQPGRELRDMYVLAAGVDATNGGQWARVFRNQGYAHVTSQPFCCGPEAPAPTRLDLD